MDLPGDIASFPIHYQEKTAAYTDTVEYVYDVEIEKQEYLRIRSFKNLLFVTLAPGIYQDLSDAAGMMGDWEDGRMLARDGVTEMEHGWQFAAEWQVRDTEASLFQTARAPQYPQQCLMPQVQEGRKLTESIRSEAELACAHWGSRKDKCIFDVVATGDLELAEAGYF